MYLRQRHRQEGSATLIKEKEQRGQGIEDEGQKQGSGAGTHGQCREAWKTTESSGVTESSYSKYTYVVCHQLGFLGLLLG